MGASMRRRQVGSSLLSGRRYLGQITRGISCYIFQYPYASILGCTVCPPLFFSLFERMAVPVWTNFPSLFFPSVLPLRPSVRAAIRLTVHKMIDLWLESNPINLKSCYVRYTPKARKRRHMFEKTRHRSLAPLVFRLSVWKPNGHSKISHHV